MQLIMFYRDVAAPTHPGPQHHGTWLCDRTGRYVTGSGKMKGGGIVLYVNEQWCNPGHVHVKECLCSPNVELLAVKPQSYYLPREFSSVIQLIPRTLQTSSALLSPVCRCSSLTPSWLSLGTLVMLTWTERWLTSHSMWTAPLGTIKVWTCCMLMHRMHTVPLPFPPLAGQITTWFCSN